MRPELILFAMISIQCLAQLWFQSKGGVTSHKMFMAVNGGFMTGQLAQIIDSYGHSAHVSLTIAAFFFVTTGFGVVKRFLIMRKSP